MPRDVTARRMQFPVGVDLQLKHQLLDEAIAVVCPNYSSPGLLRNLVIAAWNDPKAELKSLRKTHMIKTKSLGYFYDVRKYVIEALSKLRTNPRNSGSPMPLAEDMGEVEALDHASMSSTAEAAVPVGDALTSADERPQPAIAVANHNFVEIQSRYVSSCVSDSDRSQHSYGSTSSSRKRRPTSDRNETDKSMRYSEWERQLRSTSAKEHEVTAGTTSTTARTMTGVAGLEDCKRGKWIYKGNHNVYDVVPVAPPCVVKKTGETEARILYEMSHENIVRIVSQKEIDGETHVFIEKMDIGDLKQYVTEVQLDEDEIAYVSLAVARALAHIKSKGYVHCDVKSQNVLVDSSGCIKVTDFDITTPLDRMQYFRGGTKAFTAPEILLRCAGQVTDCGSPVDVFSFGCLLLDLQPCLRGKLLDCALFKPLGHAIAFPRGNRPKLAEVADNCPGQQGDFIRSCLRADPAARATIEELLSHPFLDQADAGREKFIKNAKAYSLRKVIEEATKKLEDLSK